MSGYSPYEPFGPHGPAGSPVDVTPNPTPAGESMNIGGGDSGFSPGFGGGSYAAGAGPAYNAGGPNPMLTIVGAIFTFFALLVVTIPLACLYPLTAAAALSAAIFMRPLLVRSFTGDADTVLVCTLALVLVVTYVVIRLEYRLAQNPQFRMFRHGVRLLLFGVIGVPTILFFMNPDTPFTYTMFVLKVLATPRLIVRWLAMPVNDAILLGGLVGLHFLLWNAERLRAFWHRRLRSVGLK